MPWSDDYRIGNDLIDGEHKEIFGRVDQLMAATADDEVRDAAVFLASYVIKHFSDEEALMRDIGYPGYEAHVQMHSDFRVVVEEKMMVISTTANLESLKVDLYNAASAWLITHILGEDMRIGRFMRKQAKGQGLGKA
jgi:hemerythrin